MNLFWPSLGVWAYFSHKARKEKKKEDAIYDRAIRDAVEEHTSEQTEYDQWVKSLPTIYGPSTFDVRVNTHFRRGRRYRPLRRVSGASVQLRSGFCGCSRIRKRQRSAQMVHQG